MCCSGNFSTCSPPIISYLSQNPRFTITIFKFSERASVIIHKPANVRQDFSIFSTRASIYDCTSIVHWIILYMHKNLCTIQSPMKKTNPYYQISRLLNSTYPLIIVCIFSGNLAMYISYFLFFLRLAKNEHKIWLCIGKAFRAKYIFVKIFSLHATNFSRI